jgi:cation transport ATPase
MINSVAVLIIAGPCALVLVTAISITTMSGHGAEHGVLYSVFGWLLSPTIAALAMSPSLVSVISNAPRLHTAKF